MTDENEIDPGEPVVLICSPVAWGGAAEQIAGTAEFECEECGQPIWVAPSGQKLLVSRKAKPVCLPCGQELMVEKDIEPEMPTDDQMNEVKDALLRERL